MTTPPRCTGHCHCHAGPDGLMHPACCADCAPPAPETRTAPAPEAPLRPEVLSFARVMSAKIDGHNHDRGEYGWRTASADWIVTRWLARYVEDLSWAATQTPPDPATVLSKAANVANAAMMVADVVHGFPTAATAPRPTLQEVGAAFAERLRQGCAAPETVAFFEWAVETTIARYMGWPLPPDPREALARAALASAENDASQLRDDVRALRRDRDCWRKGCEIWNDAANQVAAALLEAMAAVQVFHGKVGWELYRDHSPEMERWRHLLERVNAEVPAHLCRGGVAPPRREEPPRAS